MIINKKDLTTVNGSRWNDYTSFGIPELHESVFNDSDAHLLENYLNDEIGIQSDMFNVEYMGYLTGKVLLKTSDIDKVIPHINTFLKSYKSACKASKTSKISKNHSDIDISKAADYYAHNNFEMDETNHYKALRQGFIAGVNWRQEMSYSEQDLREAFLHGLGSGKEQALYGDNAKGSMTYEMWFEQLKNK